jgi:hypothetical protein
MIAAAAAMLILGIDGGVVINDTFRTRLRYLELTSPIAEWITPI